MRPISGIEPSNSVLSNTSFTHFSAADGLSKAINSAASPSFCNARGDQTTFI
ncbi:Uncharacterised protein [Vibrio cholerae]|nr:Uncharacterised protein [Vibrio cholerae]